MSTIDLASPSDLRALAEQSNAWPFEQAKAIVARLKKKPKDEVLFADRLRAVRPAAYRHLRRSRAHHHGAPRLSRAHRGQDQDAADRVLRRHGRPAQGAGQRAEQGDADAISRQAADQRARSVRHPFELRRAQQCAAARVSRYVRLRLRIRQLDRVLHVRKIRRGAAARAGADRPGDGDHAAVAARGARGELFAVPADLSAHRRGAVCADRGA